MGTVALGALQRKGGFGASAKIGIAMGGNNSPGGRPHARAMAGITQVRTGIHQDGRRRSGMGAMAAGTRISCGSVIAVGSAIGSCWLGQQRQNQQKTNDEPDDVCAYLHVCGFEQTVGRGRLNGFYPGMRQTVELLLVANFADAAIV